MKSNALLHERTTTIGTHERILQRTGRIVEQSKQLAALNLIASTVSQSLDLQHIINSAVAQLRQLIEFEAGVVFLLDESSGELVLTAHQGLSDQQINLIERLRPREEFIAAVIRTAEPLVGEVPWDDGRPLSKHLRRNGFGFFAAIPLRANTNTLGVIVLADRRQRQVDSNSSEFLTSVGNLVGMAIENASLYGNIARLLEETRLQADRLGESERQFRAVVESATDAVAIIQDGRFEYVNTYGLTMLGYSAAAARTLGFLDVVHPDCQEMVTANHLRRLWGETVPPYDATLVRKDGTNVPVNINGCFIEYQQQPALLIIARDITEPKRLREQIYHSEKMTALGQLIGGVAHELNNPLTTVIGYSQLLCLEEELPEPIEQGLHTIHKSARRAAKIVQNLLTFARQHRGCKSPVNINNLLERTLALRAYELKVNNIEIVKALAADLPLTVADAQQLQQVFINLIINAEQAMLEAHGQGRLVIQTREKPTASPAPDAPAREIEVVIADDGPGVVPAHFNRIFEPFFTTKPVGQGTGLGLSVSHSIIQEHGGRLSAHNRADGGATFIIELPVVEPAAVPETASPEAPLRDVSHPMRVLIIDDEPAIVGLLERIVLAEGHRVDTAADGAQALAQLEQHSYDVIFCDMKMPFLSGPGLYQELKRRNGTMTQKMIFITGDVIGDDTRTFLEQTGSRCLEKPFVREDVIRVVQSLLVDEVLQD